MLSQTGIYNLHWTRFPFLGTVLDAKWTEFSNSFYSTSISEAEFDQLRRLVVTAALVSRFRDDLLGAVQAGGGDRERARRSDALECDLLDLSKGVWSAEEYVRQRRRELEEAVHQLRSRLHADISQAGGTLHE